MAVLGNSRGKNRGKKYKKVTGDEVLTAQDDINAADFNDWYVANVSSIRSEIIAKMSLDEDIFNDTYIRLYEQIVLKRYDIANCRTYFMRSYYTNWVQERIKSREREQVTHSFDEDAFVREDVVLKAPDFDYKLFEDIIETLNSEVYAYVNEWYDRESVSLFEMYIGLQPNISYKKLAEALGLSHNVVRSVLTVIKRDVVREFTDRKDSLLKLL